VPQEPDRLLTTGEAAEILSVSPSTVINYADAGLLKAFRLPGGHRRFRRSDVEALLDPERAA
jgi:excisionase family DNA binding protein